MPDAGKVRGSKRQNTAEEILAHIRDELVAQGKELHELLELTRDVAVVLKEDADRLRGRGKKDP